MVWFLTLVASKNIFDTACPEVPEDVKVLTINYDSSNINEWNLQSWISHSSTLAGILIFDLFDKPT